MLAEKSLNNLQTAYPCDLHCHTVRSDGKDTQVELIDRAASLGMCAVAITDHDIDPPEYAVLENGQQVKLRDYAVEKLVILVPGYEFSTNTHVDDVHICGYVLDWRHPDLQEEVRAAARSKSDAYAELCNRLTAMGMPVSWEDDILHYTTPGGQPATRAPDEVQRKHIFEIIAAKGYTESWSAAKLMVRENPDLNVQRRKIDSHECIRLIHRCGGIAILAHPYLIDEPVYMPGQPPIPRQDYIHSLIDSGLDGIEVRYTYDKTTYKGSQTPEEIETEVRLNYGDRVKFLSGGSDYHADQKSGAKKQRRLGERGITVDEFRVIFDRLDLDDPAGLYQ